MKTLTASDRAQLIRLASSLEEGDEARRAILSALKKVSVFKKYLGKAVKEGEAGVYVVEVSPGEVEVQIKDLDTRGPAGLNRGTHVLWERRARTPKDVLLALKEAFKSGMVRGVVGPRSFVWANGAKGVSIAAVTKGVEPAGLAPQKKSPKKAPSPKRRGLATPKMEAAWDALEAAGLTVAMGGGRTKGVDVIFYRDEVNLYPNMKDRVEKALKKGRVPYKVVYQGDHDVEIALV